MKSKYLSIISSILALSLSTPLLHAADLNCDWSDKVSQQWIGRHFWQNSYRDWIQANGRIEVVIPGGDRSAVITSHSIDATKPFHLETRAGQLTPAQKKETGWGGFKLA